MTERKILAAVDLGHPDAALSIVKEAAAQAKCKEAELHVLCVLPVSAYANIQAYIPSSAIAETNIRAQEEMQTLIDQVDMKELVVKQHIKHGSVYQKVLKSCESWGCELIVFGARHPGRFTHSLGSNAVQISRYANVSILMIRV